MRMATASCSTRSFACCSTSHQAGQNTWRRRRRASQLARLRWPTRSRNLWANCRTGLAHFERRAALSSGAAAAPSSKAALSPPRSSAPSSLCRTAWRSSRRPAFAGCVRRPSWLQLALRPSWLQLALRPSCPLRPSCRRRGRPLRPERPPPRPATLPTRAMAVAHTRARTPSRSHCSRRPRSLGSGRIFSKRVPTRRRAALRLPRCQRASGMPWRARVAAWTTSCASGMRMAMARSA